MNRRFGSGVLLVISAPLGLLIIAFYLAAAAFGAGLGDAPASSLWSVQLVWTVSVAAGVLVVMFGCGVYQLTRSTSRTPTQPKDIGG
jgi:Na+/melibiose symporter-like transporter